MRTPSVRPAKALAILTASALVGAMATWDAALAMELASPSALRAVAAAKASPSMQRLWPGVRPALSWLRHLEELTSMLAISPALRLHDRLRY